jgi:hypothetical protein
LFVDPGVHPRGPVDQLAKHFDVDVVEALDVQAALPVINVPSRSSSRVCRSSKPPIDHQMLFTWREARDRRIALWLNSPEFWDGLPPPPP